MDDQQRTECHSEHQVQGARNSGDANPEEARGGHIETGREAEPEHQHGRQRYPGDLNCRLRPAPLPVQVFDEDQRQRRDQPDDRMDDDRILRVGAERQHGDNQSRKETIEEDRRPDPRQQGPVVDDDFTGTRLFVFVHVVLSVTAAQ